MECYIDEARTPAQQRIMACITRWRGRGDRRALFAAAYTMCVDSVHATARKGRFCSSAFVTRLLDEWAEYYLVTVDPADDDLTLVTPPAWSLAHVAAAADSTASMDLVLLAMSAHCTNDLPQALADVLREEWPLGCAQLAQREADVTRMLAVVADTLQDIACVMARFDAQLLDARERVQVQRAPIDRIGAVVRSWTHDVWESALALVTAPSSTWHLALRESIECTAARRAHLVVCTVAQGALLCAPVRELDAKFPHRHEAPACRLGVAAPVWGLEPATAS